MKQTIDYQQQAIDFLHSTNTEFSAKFLKSGKHFDDDKEQRDIYEISLKRGNRSYTFKFGQSINCSGKYKALTAYAKSLVGQKSFANEDEMKRIKVVNRFSLIKSDFSLNKNFAEPTPYDVLACVTKYDPGTFEDFCSEFGYDTDSKRAEKTYKAVCDEWLNICKLFTDAEIEQLQEIN